VQIRARVGHSCEKSQQRRLELIHAIKARPRASFRAVEVQKAQALEPGESGCMALTAVQPAVGALATALFIVCGCLAAEEQPVNLR
jgi:hypothetical protein